MSQLDKVSANEFREIVLEMKPSIGCMGGRYFKTAKRSYTMNQITKKYFELIDSRSVALFGKEGGEISSLIIVKSNEADALLKKASCFQKKMTKFKQKWGNRFFRSNNYKFIGKKGAFDLMKASLLVNVPSSSIASPKTLKALGKVDSENLISLPDISCRKDFKDRDWETPSAIWTYSKNLVPEDVLKRLIKLKKDMACNVKYEVGDDLTNMEGALHTFVTPVSLIHKIDANQLRQVVLSGVVQPDFEFDTVFMEVAQVRQEAIVGKPLRKKRTEEALQKHMIYHLTRDHRLPSKHEVQEMSLQQLASLQIQSVEDAQKQLKNKVMVFNNKWICLEVMFNTYLHQMRNEFRLLEEALPQGYVYTMSHPTFLQALKLDGAPFNRLRALAFKYVNEETPLNHMKICAFDDAEDPGMIESLKKALPDKEIISTSQLNIQKLAFVIHSNCNGFGQNIEFEDEGIGLNSDAYAAVARHRNDYFATSAKSEFHLL